MGLFTHQENQFDWIPLVNRDQLQEIFHSEGTFLVFKHSTRCSISSMALNRFEREWDNKAVDCQCFYLDLLSYRTISDEIAQLTGITHESPQVILIKNSNLIYNASHHKIDATSIIKLLQSK